MFYFDTFNYAIIYVFFSLLFLVILIARVVLKVDIVSDDVLLAIDTLLVIVDTSKCYRQYLIDSKQKYY